MASRSQRKLWRSLRRRKGRAEHGLFLAEGPRVVADLLASGLPTETLIVARPSGGEGAIAELARRAAAAGVPVEEVSEAELAEIAPTVSPQGVLAVGRLPRPGWPGQEARRILVVDGVADPGNVGTLIRTAEAVGTDAVVCLEGTADPWSPKAVRAAAGSVFRVTVLRLEWETARSRLREGGLAVWAADPAGDPFFRGEVAPARVALVVGNEAHGVSPAVLETADRRVSIPMAGRAESLNVAAAAAILLDRALGGGGLEEGGGVGGR